MNETDLRQFRDSGYLIVKNALSAEMVTRLLAVVGQVDAAVRDYEGADAHKRVSVFNLFDFDPYFLELIDHPKILPIVVQLLGPAIQLYLSHLVVYPPERGTPKPEQGIHQDGVAIREDLRREGLTELPLLSLKVSYWLSDVKHENQGAFRIMPGTRHVSEFDPKQMKYIYVDTGDVIIHDRRVLHSRGVNTSRRTRITIFMGYSYRWIRPLGKEEVASAELIESCDAIRQQLLGAPFGWNSYHEPQHLPLGDIYDLV